MNRKRKFELPLWNNLNKDQLKAIHLPKEGAHLIIGGPGTGKSVAALLRVRKHHSQKKADYCFLVYNYLLHEASQQLMEGVLECDRWISWIKKLFLAISGHPVNVKNGKSWEIDWDDINKWISEQSDIPKSRVDYLIIDEGQDMPPHFYNVLINLGFENFYVVADQNQALTKENSLIEELEDAIAIEHEDVIKLRTNYRNTYPIARLAREFYTDPATPPPEYPNYSSGGRTVSAPKLVEYGENNGFSFQKVIMRILIMSDNSPSKLIGILTPNNKAREQYFRQLNQASKTMKLDHDARIITYASSSKNNDLEDCNFAEGGIFVINSQSCKGLEFETVFIVDINDFPFWPSIEDEQKRLFYVMVARARENVFILKREGRCNIERILPEDRTVLERWPER